MLRYMRWSGYWVADGVFDRDSQSDRRMMGETGLIWPSDDSEICLIPWLPLASLAGEVYHQHRWCVVLNRVDLGGWLLGQTLDSTVSGRASPRLRHVGINPSQEVLLARRKAEVAGQKRRTSIRCVE